MIVDPKLFCKGFEDAFGLYVYNLVIASENMQDVRFILFFTLYMFWFFPIEHIFLVSGPSSNLLPCMFCNWRSQWALCTSPFLMDCMFSCLSSKLPFAFLNQLLCLPL